VDVAVSLRISNRLTRSYRLVLEPWTLGLDIPAGRAYTVVAHRDVAPPLGVEIEEDVIIAPCFDRTGASMSLYAEDGHQLFSGGAICCLTSACSWRPLVGSAAAPFLNC